jgi:hypothetical protein
MSIKDMISITLTSAIPLSAPPGLAGIRVDSLAQSHLVFIDLASNVISETGWSRLHSPYTPLVRVPPSGGYCPNQNLAGLATAPRCYAPGHGISLHH